MGVGGDESGICYVGPPSEAQSWQKIMEFCQIMEFCHSLESYDSKLKLLTEVFAFGLPAQPKPTRESKQLHCDRSAAAAAAASFSEKLGVSVTRPRQLAS